MEQKPGLPSCFHVGYGERESCPHCSPMAGPRILPPLTLTLHERIEEALKTAEREASVEWPYKGTLIPVISEIVREFAAEQLREAAAWAHVRALADPVMIGGPGPIVDGFGLTRNELLRRADALLNGD